MSNLKSYHFIADENISVQLVHDLRKSEFDIIHTSDVNLNGRKDYEILELAYQHGKVIITHDNDFGKIINTSQLKFIGIIYLRPGHLNYAVHIKIFEHLSKDIFELTPPFLIVVERSDSSIKIRIRNNLG